MPSSSTSRARLIVHTSFGRKSRARRSLTHRLRRAMQFRQAARRKLSLGRRRQVKKRASLLRTQHRRQPRLRR
ncbi:MAG: hypothetical protein AAGL18_10165 [Pseudomonadota bacterium]